MDAPEDRQDVAAADVKAEEDMPAADERAAPGDDEAAASDTGPETQAHGAAEDGAPASTAEAVADVEAEVVAEEAVPEVDEGANEQDVSDLAAIDGASLADLEAESVGPAATASHEDMSAHLHQPVADQPTELAADIASTADEAGEADETHEGVAWNAVEPADDFDDAARSLETPEGVSPVPADTQSLQSDATDEQVDGPAVGELPVHGDDATELAADIAFSSSEVIDVPVEDVDSPSLAADMAETSDAWSDVPEELGETSIPDAEHLPDDEETRSRSEFSQAEPAQPELAQPETVEPEPVIAEADAEGSVATEDVAFDFDRGGRPVRFVWKLDANGVFAEVSGEFARTVGPISGAIIGQSFRGLAALYELDPDQQIADLLDKRDTWSGRTVRWPVEGTDLVVPVDLAALPTYSRNREFDGFRGFGIIRVGDAETDPNAFGLGMTAESELAGTPELEEDPVVAEAEEPVQDEFRGEVPALDIVSNPLASFSDKVIKLEERRAKNARDGLSASEQAALREIARQLEPFGKRPNDEVLNSGSDLPATEDRSGDAGEADADLAQDDGFQGQDILENTSSDEMGVNAVGQQYDDGSSPHEQDDAGLDEQGVQTLFEDLGTGTGLTAETIDHVPMAILIHAGDHLIEANAEFRRLTGYDRIADLERAGGLDALITRREGPDSGVYLVRADGMQVLVSARLQSVRYEGSGALMLALTPAAGMLLTPTSEPVSLVEDEVDVRLAALQVEVDELHSILETATDGVIVLDTEGRIRSMNRSAAALFNFDDRETQGKPFAMLFAHESQKSVQDYLAGLAGHGVASVLNDGREVIGREASGGFLPLFMTMGRLPGSNRYCAVIRDITQWKRSEEELRTAKRAAETANQHKSDFLARVSHEIRTPLNAIIGFSDMIANEHFGPAGHPRYVEYAADIGRSGRHVLDIVNDLLDISKIEAGEMDLEFAAVGINDCVSEAVSLVQPQANAQRVIIRTSLSQSVPDVVADLRSIKQIALNILANAIRYTPSGGQIVVSTAYESSGSVTLRIRDTGVGMSKSELDQAMKPFGQVSSGTRQRGDGTGLGLPLTRAMTEANRATFAIHSAPNEGTLVEITFPPQRVLAD
ncbi:MAG: PAS domain S-box protein [Rhizobium sp.]|nr:PAS domain S-box protein [Rhizobium sp.]